MLAKRLKAADFACAIAHAVDVLKNGGLVAFPTDTVYGLAAPAFEAASIERLYVVKGRNSAKAIAILLGGVQQLPQVTAHMTPLAARLAERFWPGPLTLVVPRHPALPTVLAPDATIGVRMPDHPVALALLRLAGPLAVTSANLTGGANACRAQEVLQQLNGRIHLLLDGGATPGGVPSTVVDCTGAAPAVLRAGPITQAQIDAALAE
jgi:L-threonylcarbamoyladenylate synthase